MKTYKKGLIIISLFFILMLSLGAISASENITGDLDIMSVNPDIDVDVPTISNEDNEICAGVSSSHIVLAGGTFDDIQSAIDECEEGGTIELSGNYTGVGKYIVINKTITIIGAENTMLDAQKNSGIFKFTTDNKTVSLNGLTLVNAKDRAIFEEGIISFGNYSINNCNFENNSCCMKLSGDNATCFLSDCIFTNNKGYSADDAIIYRNPVINLFMINCNLTNNQKNIFYFGKLGGYIKNCNFINSSSGGIYYIDSIINCTFKDIILESTMLNGVDSIINSTFKNNKFSSSCHGSTMMGYVNLISNCVIMNNSAEIILDDSYMNTIGSANTVINSEFKNNNFTMGIYVGKAINCTFTNNYGAIGSAISRGLWDEDERVSKMSLNSCYFINNTAEYEGGAIYFDYGIVNITDCDFINNKVIKHSYYGGGALDFHRSVATIVSCNFINNYAASYGSAISSFYIEGVSPYDPSQIRFTIKDSNFTNNIAEGIYLDCGYDVISYGNGTIGILGAQVAFDFINCTPLIKNDELFKLGTKIVVPKLSMAYKEGKYLIVKVKSPTRALLFYKNLKVKIALNGNIYRGYTDENGQVKIPINLPPNTYKVVIVCVGNNFYKKSTLKTTIKVKKITAKITANPQTFKYNQKIKKYRIKLEYYNKPMKNTQVFLKVGGKTYVAKTLSNGVATFKLTKLTGKGTYKAKITYVGGKYFYQVTTKVKIKVK